MASAGGLQRVVGATARAVVGGSVPLDAEQFAQRAYRYHRHPGSNPVKEVMDAHGGRVKDTPPMLGIFNDIPWNKLREDEVQSWAKAGFSWVVNDGEHSLQFGHYGREQNAMIARAGMLPVQRLHREAVSEHGDSFQLGARATMRPYGTTVAEAAEYFRAVNFPVVGKATPQDRGGYPVRDGARNLAFTPADLRAAETETQGWIQFETAEYISGEARDQVLDLMAAQGPNRAAGFIGPFDAVMRGGDSSAMAESINALIREAAARNLCMGRVVGSGSMTDPAEIEDAMVQALDNGARLIAVHVVTSDLPFFGAREVTAPFFRACARAGF